MTRPLKLLLALVLTVRSLLPVGFMLAVPQTGDGLMTVVICAAHGAQTITVDRDGQPVPSKTPSAEILQCPYAATGVALIAPPKAALEWTGYVASVVYASVEVRVAAPHRIGGHSARGPPFALI